MKYTFLLPAYKAAYLDEALQSILAQTYTDFNVVISNDCSPQDLDSIVERYLDDPRVSYRCNEENMGKNSLVSHWNLLLSLCESEYFILASDDDVYSPRFLEEIDCLVNEYPKVELFHARAQCINESGEVFKEDALYKEYVSQIEYFEQLDFYNHIECIANYVFHTESLKLKGGFVDFPLAWSSDTATCNIMAEKGAVNTAEVLFSFRMSGLNISSQPVEDKKVSRQKYKAFCMYDKFMWDLLESIKPNNDLLSQTIYTNVCAGHKKRMAGLIAWMSVSLSLKEFCNYIRTYKKKGYIDSSFITIKRWFFTRIKA